MYFVRTALESDLKRVGTLLTETFHATYDGFYGAAKVAELDAAWNSQAALKAMVSRPHSEFLVADDGKRLGGMAFAAMDGESVVHLHKLYVHPNAKRQGVGRDLFAEIEGCFPAATRLRVEVEPQNTDAIAFYTAHGLEEAGRVENCGAGQSGIPALIMEKPLTPHPL